MKVTTIELLEGAPGRRPSYFRQDAESTSHRRESDPLGFVKYFYFSKGITRKVKRQATDQEKRFPIHMSDR